MSSINAARDVFHIGSINAAQVAFHTSDHSGSGSAGKRNQARQDEFRPSFYVPPNPGEVLLDFGLSLDGTEPHSPEAKVLHEILREDVNEEKTRIVSIYGKAGVGKSCILRGLGDGGIQEVLMEHFPDGIYFLSLGMDATISTLIQGLAEITGMCGGEELGRKLRGEVNLRTVMKKVREWMKERKCLIMIDDSWERNGLGGNTVRELGRMFSDKSERVLVMTTRFVDLAALGRVIKVEELEAMSAEAEAILLNYAKFEREEIEDEKEVEAFYKVLRMCGGLPLFLSVVGRGVAELAIDLGCERIVVWRKYWEEMQHVGQGELMDTESDEYPDLSKTLRLSLKLLSKRRGKRLRSLLKSTMSFQEMHRALCVFKKQTSIPISVIRRLWKARSDEGTLWIGKWFAGVGLADIEVRRLGEKEVHYMRVHDLVHMFAMDCAEGKEGIARWHGRFLEGYAPKWRGNEVVRQWWEVCREVCTDVEGDEYLSENMCRHLVSSGNVKELEALLPSGEWSKFRHEFGGLSAWRGDFWELLNGMKQDFGNEVDKETERGLKMIRDAVIESWTYVDKNPKELGYQVFGRLIDCENKVVRRYLKSIEEVQCRPWLKPMQRSWKRPGEGMMIGEFALGVEFGDDVWGIALHSKSFTAVVGVGKKVAIIDLKEMRVTVRHAGHTGDIRKVGISGDGKRAFSWSGDGSVRQWDIESDEEHKGYCIKLDEEKGDEDDKTMCAAFCPEKSLVVTGSWRGKVKVWDLRSGKKVARTMDVTDRMNCIAISPDGQIVAAGLRTGSVVLCDVQTSRPLCGELKGHVDRVTGITFSGNGQLVASRDHESTIRLWDVESKTQLGDPFARCASVPYSVVFTEDGKQIFSAHSDGSVNVWNVRDGAHIRSWQAHNRWVKCVSVTGNVGSRLAVSGDLDGTVRVWDLLATENEKDERIPHKDSVSFVNTSPDGSVFVSGSWDKTLRIWDADDGKPSGKSLCGDEVGVTSVSVSPDARQIVSGSFDGTLRVWDVETCAQVGSALRGHEGWINCVTYSPNGEFIVSGSTDGTIRVWSAVDYHENSTGDGDSASNHVRVTETGADEGLRDRGALRLDLTLRHEVPNEERNSGWGVNCVTLSRDGQKALSGLENGDIWLWDMNSGRCIDRKLSKDGSNFPIVQIEISENHEIVTMNGQNEKLRWRLDSEGCLMRNPRSEDSTGVAQAESQEGPMIQELDDVMCRGRIVQFSSSGLKLATLPGNVGDKAWTYNAQRRMLCVGDFDGRVLFFRVEG